MEHQRDELRVSKRQTGAFKWKKQQLIRPQTNILPTLMKEGDRRYRKENNKLKFFKTRRGQATHLIGSSSIVLDL